MLKTKLILASLSVLILVTVVLMKRPPILSELARSPTGQRAAVLDRWKQPLRVTYAQDWNIHEQKQLEKIPNVLKQAIIYQEDHRFYKHNGVDWLARINAIISNIRSGRSVRGASTITEQVVRIVNPRPRTILSKWIEGWEAMWLETRESKNEILEFYMNQVPFGQQRRGLVQAARLYFNRDLSTLNEKEMLALAILIKSPVKLNLRTSGKKVDQMILSLAVRMKLHGVLSESEFQRVSELPLSMQESGLSVQASHFVRFVEQRFSKTPKLTYETTLDPDIQNFTQNLLTQSLRIVRKKYLTENAAIIVADHTTGEVLAWVVADNDSKEAISFDANRVARQPGSALKPFLYGLSFDHGWSPSSLIEDTPSETAVGNGLHTFRNYSRTHYGWLSLREALANSLNIPAIKLVREIGLENFWQLLKSMELTSLSRPMSDYGEGLALGNGEVSLWEMVNAYAMLARMGVWQPLRVTFNEKSEPRRILTQEAASLVGNILSDSHARRLEFGRASIMQFPVQTALKSGTSTDYRDAWAFAYNYKYVLGIWMGNLSNKSTQGMTGSAAPMLMARSIMARLTENQKTRPLYLSPKLQLRNVAGISGEQQIEYFQQNSPLNKESSRIDRAKVEFRLVRPTAGLFMAIDPRLPKSAQSFEFEVEGARPGIPIKWIINGQILSQTLNPKISWTLQKGKHTLQATQGSLQSIREFIVK